LTNVRHYLVRISVGLVSLACATVASAADDTARYYGTWTTTTLVNGQMVTIVSVHDASGYHNSIRMPTGDVPAGDGAFSAANGVWKANAPAPNDHGVYRFVNNDTVIASNALGQTVTWVRVKPASGSGPVDANVAAKRTTGYTPPADRPGNASAPAPAGTAPSLPDAPALAAASDRDAAMSPGMTAGMQALQRKDYASAWRSFMAEAQKGNSDGEAAVGSMLFQKTNPPGTGFYAQCEKWLLSSANKGNVHGMDMLAQYYYAEGRRIAGGINPGVNTTRISAGEQAQAEAKFTEARQWFDRSAAKGDLYAMGNLAILLDAGVGGPKDPARAARLREAVKGGPDVAFANKATSNTSNLATSAAWQSGHYADAIKAAQAGAAKGDANAEALLGRAYYLGTGVPRNYATALTWLNKAVAQNNADAKFFLGLMYEHAAGVSQDIPKAMQLFDSAAAQGQRYAEMEAKGMRMQGESNRVAAQSRGGVMEAACATAGGVSVGPECIKTGVGNIDPFDAAAGAR
jgi:TPR repeat protein